MSSRPGHGSFFGGETRIHALVVTAGVLIVMAVGSLIVHGANSLRAAAPGGLLLLGAAAVCLYVRERFPVPVLFFTTVCACTYYLGGYPLGFEPLPALVALYTVMASGRRLWGIAGAVLILGATTGPQVAQGHPSALEDVPIVVLTMVTVLVLGELARSRRVSLHQAERRAEEVERTREEEARRQVVEERLRIARELHDTLAHNVAMISVQSTAALSSIVDDTESETHRALRAIRQASAQILDDMRATVGMLRETGPPPDEGAQPRGVADIDRLVDRTRASGLVVGKSVTGRTRQLCPGGELVAYRVVQESLTNVIRHAGHAEVQVTMAYGDGVLQIDVQDDGASPATPSPGTGRGLQGLRERLAKVGGELAAGPVPEGGFQVRARIPLEAAT